MKKSIVLLLVPVVALALTGLVWAQTEMPYGTHSRMTGMHKVMEGTLVSLDAVANTIVVKTKAGEETFHVEPNAKIMMGKKVAKLAELSKDTKVTVMYKTEGASKMATEIKAHMGKKAEEMKEAPTGTK